MNNHSFNNLIELNLILLYADWIISLVSNGVSVGHINRPIKKYIY